MADDAALRLAALKAAKASGVLTVRHGDTMTTFRSLAEIDRIILSLEAEIASAPNGANGAPARVRLRYPIQTTKGL
jgi:hypothetical protein